MEGLITRGGISVGRLEHDGKVVFGLPLVEAATLEKKVAVYPRVVFSENVEHFIAKSTGEHARSLVVKRL